MWVDGREKLENKQTVINDVGCCYPAYEMDDVMQDYAKFRAKGVPFVSSPQKLTEDKTNFYSAFVTDPDGYFMELRQPV